MIAFLQNTPVIAFVVTLCIGVIGVWIARLIHLPVPYLLGAMIAIAAYNILTGAAYMPSWGKIVTQACSGIFIGLSLSRNDIRHLKDLLGPALILVGCFLVFTAAVGSIMYFVFGFDAATAYLICVPGGVVDVSLMAYDLGAEPAIVSFVQSFRVFFVYLVFPLIISWVGKRVPESNEGRDPLSADAAEISETWIDRIIPDQPLIKHIVTLAIGILGAVIGKKLGIPAGALSFSMLFAAVFHLFSHRAMFDKKYKKIVQIAAGALIAVGITMDTVRKLPSVIVPTAVLMICYVLFNFVIARLMSRTKKIDYVSAMFSSSPGGASDMALIASDLGGQSPKIAILQILRLISVYVLFPTLVKIMISLVS